MDKEIIIYTNDQCRYCADVKEELTKNNIQFENRLTSKFEKEYKSITSLVNMGTVPIIYYKKNYFIAGRDFNSPTHLLTVLDNFKKSNFSMQIQILEKVKTLHYSTNIAFGRLDQLLRKVEDKLKIKENEHKSTD